jgi:hypothetical protein
VSNLRGVGLKYALTELGLWHQAHAAEDTHPKDTWIGKGPTVSQWMLLYLP